MSESNRSYRIRTKVGRENEDKFINVSLNQDYDVLEILSLKIDTTNFYKLHTSSYGCIAGRVLANGGVGIPNAKISVFIPVDEETQSDPVLSELYPFATSFAKDSDGIRYNLLPDTEVKLCHTKIGTFPDKRLVLDDNKVTHTFDKYYKYTTRTNDAGDYMIFGVPVGDHVIHTDIDLSDIGILSQKPIDMMYKGYDVTQFENPKKFKTDTNIDALAQVISQNDSVYVFPFWGEETDNQIKITRNDIDVQYKFEPSCVFIGSLVTDDNSNGIQKDCIATERMGKMDTITTGYGTIEMIRKTADGSTEEVTIQGNQLIDGNGTWCYQIPMNLDYYMTDEYGNLVPSDDKEKGIPTRTRVRFRVSLGNFKTDQSGIQIVKVLIPNNPKDENDVDYHFGSLANDDKFATKSFRDLFWNNVYTVKSYIPRIQKGNNDRNKSFTGFKQVNVKGSNNPIPYNNMRVHLSFHFALQCAILKLLIRLTMFINWFRSRLNYSEKQCTVLGDGICPDLENWYFAPGCDEGALNNVVNVLDKDLDSESIDVKNKPDTGSNTFCVTNKIDYLMQCVEVNLAMEYDVIQFDFYNDWINGLVYIPKWYVNLKKKHSYMFGTLAVPSRIEGCMESSFRNARRYVQQCSLTYAPTDGNKKIYTTVANPRGCSNNTRQQCHTGHGRNHVEIFGTNGGLVHDEQTKTGAYVYYAKPAEWIGETGSQRKRCLLFATDIVLLGSLNNFDESGVPNAFENLLPTTYKMPTNLAATNMDNKGYMYGIASTNKGARCKGRYFSSEPAKPLPQTFETYVEWSRNTSYYESKPDDAIEMPMTTAAGIDWGYSGPNQGNNSLYDLYFPGGHFIGMACFNAETNIKSCVNLARICEIGTTMSERHTIVTGRESGSNYQLQYANIIPNGLVNKYDITDQNFRRIFASMNHNGLKTRLNPDTSYLEYDLLPMMPNSFDGELSQYTNASTNYNGEVKYEASAENYGMTFTSTLESADEDYYNFRLGITDPEKMTPREIKQRYLIENGDKVSLPMYENSFYFYFGLKDGNTALDRFFRDFHAKCDTNDLDSSYVNVDVAEKEFCAVNGMADITINDVESPYTMMLKMDDPNSPYDKVMYLNGFYTSEDGIPYLNASSSYTSTSKIVLTHNYINFRIKTLDRGTYMLTIASEGAGNVTVRFKVNEAMSEDVANTDIIPNDFTDNNYSFDENALSIRVPNASGGYDIGGFFDISSVTGSAILGIIMYTESKYCFIPRTSGTGLLTMPLDAQRLKIAARSITGVTGIDFDQTIMKEVKFKEEWRKVYDEYEEYLIPAWKGNESYTFTYIIGCGNNYKGYSVTGLYIKMNTPLDVYFGDGDLTYLNTIKPLMSSGYTWHSKLLFETNTQLASLLKSDVATIEKKKWNLKQSLYYRDSMYDNVSYGNINVYPTNGVSPFTELVSGKTETMVNRGDYVEYTLSSGDTSLVPLDGRYSGITDGSIAYDMHAFYVPTQVIASHGFKAINFTSYKGFEGYTHIDKGEAQRTNYNGFMMPTNMYNNVNPNIPNYKYIVTDSSGRGYVNGRVPSSSGSLDLPSVYRPFFVYALTTIVGRQKRTSITITNPVLYNGKIGMVKVNGNDYTQVFNSEVERYIIDSERGADVSWYNAWADYDEYANMNYRLGYRNIESYYIPDSEIDERRVANLKVEITDGYPAGYDDTISPKTITDSIGCTFPTKNIPYYSSGVRFYVIGSDNAGHRYDWMEAYVTRGRLFEDNTHYEWYDSDRQWGAWNGIFGGRGCTTKNEQFDIQLKDITAGVYRAFYGENDSTTDAWTRFVKYIEEQTGTGREQDGSQREAYVLAVYDKWTLSDTDTNEGDVIRGDKRRQWNMFKNVTPDTTILCIAKLYTPDELYNG